MEKSCAHYSEWAWLMVVSVQRIITHRVHTLTRLAYVIWARKSNMAAYILERMRAHESG